MTQKTIQSKSRPKLKIIPLHILHSFKQRKCRMAKRTVLLNVGSDSAANKGFVET